MNVIYYRNIETSYGWKWRLEVFTASATPLAAPSYVELPDGAIADDIEWSGGYDKLPCGLPNTPSLKLRIDVSTLTGSAELEFLRERLYSPFVDYQYPPVITAGETITYWQYDETSGTYSEVTETLPSSTQPPVVPHANLSNVFRLMCNFGNPAQTFAGMTATQENSENTTIVFTGVQQIGVPLDEDWSTTTVSIECLHVTRFVLEQVNPSMVAQVAASFPATVWEKTKMLVHTAFTAASRPMLFVSAIAGAETYTESLWLLTVEKFSEAITIATTTIRNVVLRGTTPTFEPLSALGQLQFARWYKQNIATMLPDGVVNTSLYVLGRVYSPTEKKVIGGILHESSEFWKYKNMFDFVVDVYSGACTAQYIDVGVKAFPLGESTFAGARGGGSVPEITSDDIQIKKLRKPDNIVSSVELAADGENLIVNNVGRSQVNQSGNVPLYVHNLPPNEISFDFTTEEESASTQIAYWHKVQESRLYYKQSIYSGLATMLAVHPFVEIRRNGAYSVAPAFTTSNLFPVNVFFQSWDAIRSVVSSYFSSWRRGFGVWHRIGEAILANFSSEKQTLLEAVSVLYADPTPQSGTLSGALHFLPDNVGAKYLLAIPEIEVWRGVPTTAYLVSSNVKICTGVADIRLICTPSATNPKTI